MPAAGPRVRPPRWRRLGVALVAALWLAGAHADETPQIRPETYQRLQTVEKLLDRQKYGEAEKWLRQMLPAVEGIAYEEAVVLRLWAAVHLEQEQYAEAAERLARCLETGGLPEAQQRRVVYDLGQLYVTTGQYEKAVARLRAWLAEAEEPPAKAYLMLGRAHAELEQLRPAAEAVSEAIDRAGEPEENWYRFLLGLYFELEDLPACADLLERMVQYFPEKEDYWLQLAGVHQRQGHNEQALAVRELAYRQGLLDSERQILDLAALYRYLGAPQQAARLLEKEIAAGGVADTAEHWKRLANAWRQARENAKEAEALAEAAAGSGDPKLWLRLARAHREAGDWEAVVAAADRALAAGVEEPGQAHLLRGTAFVEMDKVGAARGAFAKARKAPESEKAAKRWLEYLDERERPLAEDRL